MVVRMFEQSFFWNWVWDSSMLYNYLSAVSGQCDELHFTDNTPNLSFNGTNYDLSFQFSAPSSSGTFQCILRQLDSCPPTITAMSCAANNAEMFQDLGPGLPFCLSVRCTSGTVVRLISRTFETPADSIDCTPLLINDGISYTSHDAISGDAVTVFEWSSSGTPTGFMCSIDDNAEFVCKWINPIHPKGNMYESIMPNIKPPYIISHKLMGSLWGHTGAIGCIVLVMMQPIL